MKTLILLLAAGISSGLFADAKPLTSPTTRPVLIDIGPLQRELWNREANLETLIAADRSAWENSKQYQELKTEMDSRKATLEAARKGEDASAKLDASKAYNDARIKFEQADKADHSSKELPVALAYVSNASRALAEAVSENARRQAKFDSEDPATVAATKIKDAIKRHTIVVGMTLEQANESMSSKGSVSQDDGRRKWIRWEIGGDNGLSGRGFYSWAAQVDAEVVNGKIVSIIFGKSHETTSR